MKVSIEFVPDQHFGHHYNGQEASKQNISPAHDQPVLLGPGKQIYYTCKHSGDLNTNYRLPDTSKYQTYFI